MQPFFLPVRDGQRFCLFHAAVGTASKGRVLYIHPFAEEMNKTRRMAALQARALASAGYEVLQVDLLGCGDSSGDFSDASWQAWREDVLAGYRWLCSHSSAPPILWGLRVGCLLAAEVLADIPESADLIFWQPVISGKQYWQQFMRLKMAGEIASGKARTIGEHLRQQLALGQVVEIAGYGISPELVSGLEQADLTPTSARYGRLIWLETALRDDPVLTPIAQKCIEQWQAAGYIVDTRIACSPAFWQTTEIEDAPQLIAATLAALEVRA